MASTIVRNLIQVGTLDAGARSIDSSGHLSPNRGSSSPNRCSPLNTTAPHSIEARMERFKRHGWVVGALVAIATVLSLLLWFHPTLGFAQGGILDGADLRSDLIQLLWWAVAAITVGSTLVLAAMPARWRAPLRFGAAYVTGLAVAIAIFPILDHYY